MATSQSPVLRISATLLFLVNFFAVGYGAFNCTRSGCYNGGLCELGKCICMGSQTTGYDCSHNKQYMMQGECLTPQNLCHNGGTCYDMMMVGAQRSTGCYCSHEYYGEYCEYDAVKTECYADRMIINVFPGENFAGSVFVHNPNAMPPMPGMPATPSAQCLIPRVKNQVMFNLDPVRRNWFGYAAQLFYNGTMCGVQPNITTSVTEIIYTYEIMVQYDPYTTNPHVDEIISFSCPRPKAIGAIGPTAVLFSVADAAGARVHQPKLGSPVTISFSVDPSSIFTDILVQSCIVSSAMNGMSEQVVKDSCPVKPMGKSLRKILDKHVLTLIMHSLGHDPNLSFDCAIKVCTVSDPSCQRQPFCPVTHAPSGGHHGGPIAADPQAHGVAPGGNTYGGTQAGAGGAGGGDILSMFGMGGSGGGAALDSLLAGGTGAGAAGGGAGLLGGGDTMMLQNLMNSLGGGGGGTGGMAAAPSGGGAYGGGGATAAGSTAGTGGADFLNSLMSMAGGTGTIGTNAMNDLLFGAPSSGPMGGMGPAMSPMMGYRRRRSVAEYEEEKEQEEELEERIGRKAAATVVRIGGRFCE